MISRRAVWAAQAMAGLVVLDFQGGFFGVPDDPEQHRIHIDRHGILGQRFFGAEGRDHHAVVDPDGDGIDHRHHPEDARPRQSMELAQAQHHCFFPRARHPQ